MNQALELLKVCGEAGVTFASAESCTGGNIAHQITLIPGSSSGFMGGVVSYNNEVKMRILGVKEETLAENGAVSLPVVREMAQGVLNATGAQVAAATSGIAGPGGGSPEKPVGTVCIAVATADGYCRATVAKFRGNREEIINAATAEALAMATDTVKAQCRGNCRQGQTEGQDR